MKYVRGSMWNRVLLSSTLCLVLVACSESPSEPDPESTPEALTQAAEAILAYVPQTAGISIATLMSPAAGGQFDCQVPANLTEPAAIDHFVIDDSEMKNGAVEVTIRYFNKPETISQVATFSYVPATGVIEPLDPHAKTFLDPSQPSDDDC